MLKLIKLDDIPKQVKEIADKVEFLYIYQCEGMFGKQYTDYLIIMEEKRDADGDIMCYGYVYNGAAPSCSEFGAFGLNREKTERVW